MSKPDRNPHPSAAPFDTLPQNLRHKPVVLVILDGWGLRDFDDSYGNPIAELKPETYCAMLEQYPWIGLKASGEAVGLPEGQIGNSEVGHLNMGAGRVVYQDFTRINKAVRDGSFFGNPVLTDAFAHIQHTGGTLHLMGLTSPGGVHSHQDHLLALIEMARRQFDTHGIGHDRLRVHAFTDGRDVAPRSALQSLRTVEETLQAENFPQIATVSGRYYAMDRDTRWERTQAAYDNLTLGTGARHPLSLNAVDRSYLNDKADEFIEPVVTDFEYEGMADGDAVIFFNFRPDRARQLTRAFTQPAFDGFARQKVVNNLYFACMATYDATFDLPVAYPKVALKNILAQELARHGVRQFRTAETEKYAHVTFFFNGGFEAPWPGESRRLIASPKVATYDHQPQMSLPHVSHQVCEAVRSGQYEVVITNFANPDMVGHTGDLPATIDALKAVDVALNDVKDAVLAAGGVLLITADHGNAETMIDVETGGIHTAHTTVDVPLILVSDDAGLDLDRSQAYPLSTVSPLMLQLLGLPIPPDMETPSCLVEKHNRPPTRAEARAEAEAEASVPADAMACSV